MFIILILLASQSFAASVPSVYSLTYYGVQSESAQYHPDSSVVLGALQPIDFFDFKNGALFYDSRVKVDLSKATTHNEINLGLGYRGQLGSNRPKLFGLYGFWDVTHVQDYAFVQQATIGAEFLAPSVRATANAYFAQKDFTLDYVADVSSSAIRSFDNHYFITDQTGDIATVKSLSGMDATCEFSVYHGAEQNLLLQLGYKYFNRDDFITMQGPKVSILGESSMGKQSRRWELFWSHDDFHGASIGLTLSVRYYPERLSHYSSLDLLYSQPVIRDIDVQLSYLQATQGRVGQVDTKQSRSLSVDNVDREIIEGLFDFYVINLDKDTKRLEAFQEQFAKMGLKFNRISAVNGRYLNMQTLLADGKIAGKYARQIRPGEVGICYSQMRVWEGARNNAKPYMVVFEDDVRLPEGFVDNMAALSTYIKGYSFDVLFLGRTTHAAKICQDMHWKYVGCLENPYGLLNEPTMSDPAITMAPYSYGAFAYVVPVTHAQKLIDAHQTIYQPCDVQWWDDRLKLDLKTVNPLWFDHNATAIHDSRSWNA